MNDQLPLPMPLPEPSLLRRVLLMEKVHRTFEDWFINLFVTNQLSEENLFSIQGMRTEYLQLCWKEEVLWKKWKEASGGK